MNTMLTQVGFERLEPRRFLSGGGVITGRVLVHDGLTPGEEEGVPGARVFIDLDHDRELDGDEPRTRTDEQGHYRFEDVAPGTYRVVHRAPKRFVDVTDTPFRSVLLAKSVDPVIAKPFYDAKQSKGLLLVTGTAGDDVIEFSSTRGGRAAVVQINGRERTLRQSPIYDVHIFGRAGDDRILLAKELEHVMVVFGGAGDDAIRGSADGDMLFGDAGDDRIDAAGGDDWVHGGRGDDTLFGREGDDILFGGPGADLLRGDADRDTVIGDDGAAADTIMGGLGRDEADADLLSRDCADPLACPDVARDIVRDVERVRWRRQSK